MASKAKPEIVYLRPDEYLDKHCRIRRRIGEVPRCSCCGARATVLMEIGKFRSDWIIKDCDTCQENCCDKCSDTDENGHVTCVACMIPGK